MDKQKIIDKWINDNGAVSFDIKQKNIILHDGGLFSIEKKTVMLPRFLRLIKIKDNQYRQVVFSKKKFPHDEYYAIFWFEELNETIKYLQRMKRMLNSIGYKTDCNKKEIK